MLFTRSIRIKFGILVLLLAVAGAQETDWAQRTFGLGGYWKREAARRELALLQAEADLSVLRRDANGPSELEAAKAEVDRLRQALAEARAKQ